MGNYINLGPSQAPTYPIPAGDSSLRHAEAVNFVSYNSVTIPGLHQTSFMVSWQGVVIPPNSGVYSFVITANGGFRFSLGGEALLISWQDEPVSSFLFYSILFYSFVFLFANDTIADIVEHL